MCVRFFYLCCATWSTSLRHHVAKPWTLLLLMLPMPVRCMYCWPILNIVSYPRCAPARSMDPGTKIIKTWIWIVHTGLQRVKTWVLFHPGKKHVALTSVVTGLGLFWVGVLKGLVNLAMYVCPELSWLDLCYDLLRRLTLWCEVGI